MNDEKFKTSEDRMTTEAIAEWTKPPITASKKDISISACQKLNHYQS